MAEKAEKQEPKVGYVASLQEGSREQGLLVLARLALLFMPPRISSKGIMPPAVGRSSLLN